MTNKLSQWTRTLLKLDTMVTLRIESNLMIAEELNKVFTKKLRELNFFIVSHNVRGSNITHNYKYIDYLLAGDLELEEILFKFPNYMVSETQKMLGNDRGNTIQVQLSSYDRSRRSDFLYNTRLGFYRCASILPESLSLWTKTLLIKPLRFKLKNLSPNDNRKKIFEGLVEALIEKGADAKLEANEKGYMSIVVEKLIHPVDIENLFPFCRPRYLEGQIYIIPCNEDAEEISSWEDDDYFGMLGWVEENGERKYYKIDQREK